MKIEIGDPLSNDEHTAAEGAYARLLKARKWLYVVSAVAALHVHQAIDYAALTSATKGVLRLTTELAQTGLLVALLPLTVQYILLLIQLGTSYRVIIAERLLKKVEEVFDQAKSEIAAADSSLHGLKSALAAEEARLQELEREVEEAGQVLNQLAGADDATTSLIQDERRAASITKTAAEQEFSRLYLEQAGQSNHNARRREEISGAEAILAQRIKNFEILRRETPQANPLFLFSEYCLDATRVSLPLLLALYAIGASLAQLI